MKKLLLSFICLLGILLLPFLPGCAPSPSGTYIKDGVEYGTVRGAFRNRWWNYYERGLSFMEGEFYDEAVSDFAQAIEQRFEDQRMARTYGMHFVDYFPHREMGLAYYLSGEYDIAKKEMDLSLEQQPSAKAQYYLDKIRTSIMERQGLEISVPRIIVDLPSDEIWTKADPVIISGAAEDKQYISEIVLAGKSVFIEAADERIGFKEELELEQGEHIIDITARNLLGGKAEQEVIIHVDRQGPVITVEPFSSDTPAQNIIKGFVYDETGKITLSIDGVKVPIPEGEDVPFSAPIEPDAKSVTLLAKDKLGNETKAKVEIQSLSAKNQYPLLASRNFGDIISDAGGYRLALSFGGKDTQGPVINIEGWTDDQTVFLDKVYMEGEVRDESDIVSLKINNSTVPCREGQIIFFNHIVGLREGKNIIRVKAEDEEGNTTEETITILSQVPEPFKIGSRFSLTLIPSVDKGVTPGLSDRYDNLFMEELVNQRRFRLIEREYLDKILQEHKISRSDLADQKTALEVGRLVAAQSTLVGDFIETKRGVEIVSRLIDNETSEILAVKDVYGESKDGKALQLLAKGMAVKYNLEFPLVDGIVVQEKGDSFLTDLGEEKIKLQRRLIVYREKEPVIHPVTGKSLGNDKEIIGYARVTQVMEEMSRAEPIEGLKEVDIKVMDKVRSQ
jgi:tetratricopeptide (TPR) repeat protein